jgi:hypothetical protein
MRSTGLMSHSGIKKASDLWRKLALNNLLDSGAVCKYCLNCEAQPVEVLYIMTNKKVKPADYLFWAVKQQTCNTLRNLILIYLCDYMGKKGCTPSHASIAKRCCCSTRVIKRHIDALESGGYLTVKKRFVEGMKTSHSYTLNVVTTDRNVVPNVGNVVPMGREPSSVGVGNLVPIKHPVRNTQLNIKVKGWDEWVSYRTEIKKQMTPATVKKQIKFLEKFSPDQQQIIIDQSIQNGWAGLFEPKGHGNGQQHKSAIETVKYSDLYPSDDIVG